MQPRQNQPMMNPNQPAMPPQNFGAAAPQMQQPYAQPQMQAPQPQQQPQTADPHLSDPNTTQNMLALTQFFNNMVVMKDGSFRAVVACKSINFDLMSPQEQESVEYAYQNFLNSLDFTVQIYVRSQRVDIGPYLDSLTHLRRNTDNMLLAVLMDDYINFIDILSQEANIMDKSFFVIIPYYPDREVEKSLEESKNFFKTFSRNKRPSIIKVSPDDYDKATTEINNRIETVINGLFQLGIHSVRLNTEELGRLFYSFYNPDTAIREPLVNFNRLAHLYVKKGNRNDLEK